MVVNSTKWNRRFLLSGIVLALALLPRESAARANDDPKCSFLRRELARLKETAPAVPLNVPGNIRAAYASHVSEVGLDILNGKIASCDKKVKLSSFARLEALEPARLRNVDKVREELQGASADVVVEAVNNLYEEEAKSFYNRERVRVAVIDQDVLKDFPMLLVLLKDSKLPADLKTAIAKDFTFIQYEEAGRLQNVLSGVDKDLGMTFAYVLRVDLGARVSADEENRRVLKKTSEETLAKTVASTKLNARLTLSVSTLVVLALVGWILIRRELVNWQTWGNVLAVAGVVLVGWILVGLGLLTWIGDYVGLAF